MAPKRRREGAAARTEAGVLKGGRTVGPREGHASASTTTSAAPDAAATTAEASGAVEGSDPAVLTAAFAAVCAAYEKIDGYQIAREEKRQQREQGLFVEGVQYGEVQPRSFATVLAWMAPTRGDRFVDLGSGTGKAVLTAAALYPLGAAVGVEIQPSLHKAALRARDSLVQAFEPQTNAREIQFRCGDAFAEAWYADADLVYCTPTCFTSEMIEHLRYGAERLRCGARLAITTRTIESPALRLTHQGLLPYGKGSLRFFVYVREDARERRSPRAAPQVSCSTKRVGFGQGSQGQHAASGGGKSTFD